MSVPEHEQGGDPACWLHLFDDDDGEEDVSRQAQSPLLATDHDGEPEQR